jgi:hypothetical protein
MLDGMPEIAELVAIKTQLSPGLWLNERLCVSPSPD